MKVLVVPTIREKSLYEFLSTWRQSQLLDCDEIIIVEDNPSRTFEPNLAAHHFSWEEIDAELGESASIISRRDSAIRSFGFWKAWQMGADYIFTLDDDCHPIPSGTKDFCQSHIDSMSQPKWVELIPGKRTRGLPYFNKGTLDTRVVANVGLWIGVPDLDAVESLSRGVPIDYYPNCSNRIIPVGQYFPWCGMNFAFKRDFAVLAYFPLMGEGSPYRRFDDIWFGVIAKKICDHLGWLVSCGQPFVHHKRASDPMTNLVKEAPGIKANETFWEIVDGLYLTGTSSTECMKQVAQQLSDVGFKKSDSYLCRLGESIEKWIHLFN